MSEHPPTVLDAGPLIHLDELGCLDLLEGLTPLHTPPEVWAEVNRHRPRLRLPEVPDLIVTPPTGSAGPVLRDAMVRRVLQIGEIRALHLALNLRARLFLTDDAAARLAAEAIGFQARGTVGLIVRSRRRNTRSAASVRRLLESIPRNSTLHLSQALLRRVLWTLPD